MGLLASRWPASRHVGSFLSPAIVDDDVDDATILQPTTQPRKHEKVDQVFSSDFCSPRVFRTQTQLKFSDAAHHTTRWEHAITLLAMKGKLVDAQNVGYREARKKEDFPSYAGCCPNQVEVKVKATTNTRRMDGLGSLGGLREVVPFFWEVRGFMMAICAVAGGWGVWCSFHNGNHHNRTRWM